MSFFDFLQTVGGRLGILETASGAASGECAKIVTRTVTLEELKMQIHSEEVRTLADLPAELTVSYEKIFEAAGARAAAGTWDLARLKKFLQTLSTEDRAATQKAVLEAISSDRASTEDLIKEAAAQDQALDAFEAFVCKKVADHMAMAQHQITQMEARIQALQDERLQLAERMREDQEKLRDWRKNKRAYERELASTVGYLTDRPVVSTDHDV